MQTPHILIVEDELVTRNTLKSIFEAEGYDVFEATDGAEMHQILSENDINRSLWISICRKTAFCWRANCVNRRTSH